MALITLLDIHHAYGGAPILSGVNLSINQGERLCLIGRNGEGKSTLLKIIDGQLTPDKGERRGIKTLKLAALDQSVPKMSGTVLDAIMQGAGPAYEALSRYNALVDQCGEGDMAACDAMSEMQHELDDTDAWSIEREALSLIDVMGLIKDQEVSALSGGRVRRVLLARALITKPDVLLLDEPTNHLDIDSIEWLENYLLSARLTILFVSHDRSFVDRVATRIVELDRGVLSSYPGNYQAYLVRKQEELEIEERTNALFDKKLAQEEVWIRQGIKARRTRNEGRVRDLKKLRAERSERRSRQGEVNLNIQGAEQSGKLVLNVKNVTVKAGTQVMVSDFSTKVIRGDKIGVIGPNGIGKTTLIKALLNQSNPGIEVSGSIHVGTGVEIAFFDQLRDNLDLEATILQNVAAGSDTVEVGGKSKHIYSYLQDFLFSPDRARTPVKALSGGEKNRVLLAKQLLTKANLLVLDEPTNDLDMSTLELLEEAMVSFDGTVILISHDRAFLDAVVTQTWVFDGEDHITEYVGGYEDYLRQRPDPGLQAYTASTPAKTPAKAETRGEASETQPAKARVKLSYKQQKQLEELPKQIEALEKEQQQLIDHLAQGDIYVSDPEGAGKMAERLSMIEGELLELLEAWDELESLSS